VPPHWWIPIGRGNPTPDYHELDRKLSGKDKKVHSKWRSPGGNRYAIVVSDQKPIPEAKLLADEPSLDPDR